MLSASRAPLRLYVTVPGADGSLGPNPTVTPASPLPASASAAATASAAEAVNAVPELSALKAASKLSLEQTFVVVDSKVPDSAVTSTPSRASASTSAVAAPAATEPVKAAAEPAPAPAPASTASAAVASAPAPAVQGPVHSGVRCAVCGCQPVVGTRYRCVTCSAAAQKQQSKEQKASGAVDLCESCEATHDTAHILVKWKTNAPADWTGAELLGITDIPPLLVFSCVRSCSHLRVRSAEVFGGKGSPLPSPSGS